MSLLIVLLLLLIILMAADILYKYVFLFSYLIFFSIYCGSFMSERYALSIYVVKFLTFSRCHKT